MRTRGQGVSSTVAPPSNSPVCFVKAVQAALEDGVRSHPPASSQPRFTGQVRCDSTSNPYARAQQRSLTGRSTGPATARHPGRDAAKAHHLPRGQGTSPPRAVYLYVRPHSEQRSSDSTCRCVELIRCECALR